MKKIAVLISGSGTNLQAIIDSVESGFLSGVSIAAVISNREDAFGLTRAERHGIPTGILRHTGFPTREEFEDRLINTLEGNGVDLIALAGFMRVFTPRFVRHFSQRIMNIHPALLPSFPGTHAQGRAFDYGVRFSGCTTHFVDEGTDTGPVILQAVVPVLPDDTEQTLSERILTEEHRIYPESIRLWSQGRLRLEGRKVVILPAPRKTDEP
ncbi:MAG: phosphoribosylglycinamide formyltransferase [Proteobacteria bacterium]|nr:phosphoribosylglycinamide formyltransferase [Pseudomonadota bacterium]